MNKCIFIGNLSRDPEHSQTPNGISVCKFSIAINRTFANANGEKEVDFINIVTWRGLADNCKKFLDKGKKVAVCGSLQTRTYDDKDGIKRYITEIVADDVEFLTPRDVTYGSGYAKQQQLSELEPISRDDLPF